MKINENVKNINPAMINNNNEVKKQQKQEILKEVETIQKNTNDNFIKTIKNSVITQAELLPYYEELGGIEKRLKDIVGDLLERQGKTLKDSSIVVDAKARSEAQAMISEGGDLSPEKVSDRIVGFAKAISGGDKSKFDLLKDAIDKGFGEAKKHFGTLPKISQTTYDLVMEKLDNWKNEEVA